MRLPPALFAMVLALPAAPLAGQTADQARLIFSLGIGTTNSQDVLWRVGKQPFIVGPGIIDTLLVDRTFRRSLNVVLSGTYFPGEHLGFNVEAQLLGLATGDGCRVVFASLDTASLQTRELCRSIGREQRGATSAALSGGIVYRVASHQPIHPYGRINAGLLITQQSFIKTRGFVNSDDGTAELVLYDNPEVKRLQPYVSFGGGIVAVIGRGYQFRAEVRDNYVRVPRITGPTARQGLQPSVSTVGKHIITLTVGFDVVLERKRGRRY